MLMEAIAKKGLNSNQLKLIAIIAMTADHLTWVIWPGYQTGWPQLQKIRPAAAAVRGDIAFCLYLRLWHTLYTLYYDRL